MSLAYIYKIKCSLFQFVYGEHQTFLYKTFFDTANSNIYY